jgi:hypothetical protein
MMQACIKHKMSEEFRALFLSDEALRSQFIHMCKTSAEAADPITDSVAAMLTSTMQFCIGKHGLVMFKGGSAFPYTLMNAQQRQFLYELVHAVGSDVPCHSALACLENPLKWTIENERICFYIPPEKLEQRAVFAILLDCIATSENGSQTLCDLLVQRLGSRVTISRDTLAFVHERSKAIFAGK